MTLSNDDILKVARECGARCEPLLVGMPWIFNEQLLTIFARRIAAMQMIESLKHFDEAVECARLLGTTDAKKGYGVFTEQDSRFLVAMYESIAKHRNAIREQSDE